MATPIDIIGGFYTVGGRSWAAQDCVNYLPVAAEVTGTKTQTMLRTPPGLRPWVKVGEGPDYAIRGMHDVEGALFVVSGSKLYEISSKGVAIPLGTVPGVGRVSMAHNQIAGGNQLLVVNGNAGYVWNTLTQTFQRVTDEGYPGSSVAQFINSYIMQLEPFGRFLFFSDLADATEYNTLDRFEAEAQPDPIVSILTDQNEVVAFGTRTMQFFENTGAAQGTFQSKGVVISRGCAGRFTPVKIDNSIAWLGDDGVFYRLDGYSPRRISTHAIEEAIAGLDWSQAFGMVWTDQGHAVAYWTFPDGQTWGYDVSSGLWHRRASYHQTHEVSRRWRLSSLIRSTGKWIGGDATSGKLFVLDWDYMLEDEDQPLVSERVTQIAFNNGSRFSADSVDLLVRSGEKPTVPGAIVFPAQPIGPTISGDAPDSYLGEVYSFQYTIAVGDAPVVAVTATSLPKGLTLSKTGLLSGTLDEIGTTEFRVRARDANGLWAEVADSIQVGSVWMLLKVQDASTTEVWLSGDPATWPSANTMTPIAPSPGFASSAIGLNQVLIPPNTVGDGVVAQLPALNSAVSTQLASLGSVLRTRRVGGVTFLFSPAGTSYQYRVDGAEWTTVAAPSGGGIFDVCRLNSGRWISYLSNGASSRFIYSDQEIPSVWQDGGQYPQAVASYAMGCDGQVALMLATNTRMYRTSDGVNVETLTGSGGLYPDSRDARHIGDAIVFCGQASSPGLGNVVYTRNRGNSVSRTTVGNLNTVERIEDFSGVVVASGIAPVSGMVSNVYLSSDLANWAPSVMPFEVAGGSKAIALRVAP